MQRWIAAGERCYRAAGREDRAVRMRLDPAFDYLPVRRSSAIRDEPVERLLVDAQAAMVAGDRETASGFVTARSTPPASAATAMALARAARMAMLALGEFERGEAILAEALTYADVRAQPGRESRVLTIRAVGAVRAGAIRSKRSRRCGARSRSAARTPTPSAGRDRSDSPTR